MKGSTLFAFLGGVAIGACAALFITSEKGQELREMAEDWVDEEKDMIKRKYRQARNRAEGFIDDIKEDYHKAMTNAEEEVQEIKGKARKNKA